MLKNKRLEIRINEEDKAKLGLLAQRTTATGTVTELLDILIQSAISNVVLPKNTL